MPVLKPTANDYLQGSTVCCVSVGGSTVCSSSTGATTMTPSDFLPVFFHALLQLHRQLQQVP